MWLSGNKIAFSKNSLDNCFNVSTIMWQLMVDYVTSYIRKVIVVTVKNIEKMARSVRKACEKSRIKIAPPIFKTV